MSRNSHHDAEGPASRNVAAGADLGPLFDPPLAFAQSGPLKSMVRRGDHQTSRAAALSIEPHLSELQAAVEAAFAHHGPMTDGELEQLPEFKHYAPSTVRHRRTDLFKMGRVRALKEKRRNGRDTAPMTVWDLARRVTR